MKVLCNIYRDIRYRDICLYFDIFLRSADCVRLLVMLSCN